MSWLTVFLDLPAAVHADGVGFWCVLTGYELSEPRGPEDEFASLLPPAGDVTLKAQRLGDPHGSMRTHLDVHVDDVVIGAARAVDLGAQTVAERPGLGYVTLASPGGYRFCVVDHPASRRPPVGSWPGGESLLDQLCLDIPADLFDTEAAFWSSLLGQRASLSEGHDEFTNLDRPTSMPWRLLLQRLDASPEHGQVTGHLDWSSEDRDAEVERHVARGAELVRTHEHWTVLRDVTGAEYCVTRRRPSQDLP